MDTTFIDSFKSYQKTGNFWLDLNPLTKLSICSAFAFSALFMMDWRYGIPLSILCCIVVALAGKFKEFFQIYGKLSIILIVFIMIVRQLGTRPENVTPLVNVFGWQWYTESFKAAWDTASFILGFSGAFLVYFMTTPMRDLMYTLEQKGVSHETSYIMLAAMQNIVDLRKAATTILDSQKSRGIETEGNVIVRAKAFFPTLGPLLLSAFTGSEEKLIAMDARAFSVKGTHTFLRELEPITSKEKVLIFLAWAISIATLLSKIIPAVLHAVSK